MSASSNCSGFWSKALSLSTGCDEVGSSTATSFNSNFETPQHFNYNGQENVLYHPIPAPSASTPKEQYYPHTYEAEEIPFTYEGLIYPNETGQNNSSSSQRGEIISSTYTPSISYPPSFPNIHPDYAGNDDKRSSFYHRRKEEPVMPAAYPMPQPASSCYSDFNSHYSTMHYYGGPSSPYQKFPHYDQPHKELKPEPSVAPEDQPLNLTYLNKHHNYPPRYEPLALEAEPEARYPETGFEGLHKLSKNQVKPGNKYSAEYLLKRERNNIAVRKSREKAKRKIREMLDKEREMQLHNEKLLRKLEILSSEVQRLRMAYHSMREAGIVP